MIVDVANLNYYQRENNLQEIKINEFQEFLEHIQETHSDEQLDVILKICINSLLIMYERGYDMPYKTLLELKKHL